MDSVLQTADRGVYVIPFEPIETSPHLAGQSETSPLQRPLAAVYDAAFEAYTAAYQEYEDYRTTEHFDDIADWLDRCSAPPLLKKAFPIHRLPIAIIQNISSSLPPLLADLIQIAHINGRDLSDLTSGIRSVAVGFMGEVALSVKKSGRSGIDELERWWEGKKDKPPLLIHIDAPQTMPGNILAELIYVLTLHPKLPIRLLLSVPSISTFLSSWTHIEPSSIDLSILQAGKSRKKGAAVNAILKAGTDPASGPFRISSELADALRESEEMTGGGPMATLKALKWALLHHSVTSPLAKLAEDVEHLDELQAVINATKDAQQPDLPGSDLFELQLSPDIHSILDPSPRISILHALPRSSAFSSARALPAGVAAPPILDEEHESTSSRRQSKGSNGDSLHVPAANGSAEAKTVENGDPDEALTERGDLKELETLFALWRGAGRTVNLWDWLEGFRDSMHDDEEVPGGEKAGQDEEVDETQGRRSKRRRVASPVANGDVQDHVSEDAEDDQETAAKLHASFIRFCEEARMLGLVRARGKGVGRRADEIVKSIGLL